MASMQMAVVEGGPRLGAFESGAVATASIEFSIVSGGVACIVGAAVIAMLMPDVPPARRGDIDDVPV